MRAWYPVLVGALALQRLRETDISRRHEAKRRGRQAAPGSFPIMAAAHLGLFTLPFWEISWAHRRPHWVGFWLAILLSATGLRWWCIKSLGDQWNIRAAVPEKLDPVTEGPYRWIRHPNYLAVILEFAALPMAGGAWLSALGLSALDGVVLVDRIRAEEKLLAQTPEYQTAFAGKARFIPGIF
jgi:methyltransferase